MTSRSKIQGMLIGGAIGDALGLPVETWTPEKICEVHGGPVAKYVDPIDHKWFTPESMPAGTVSDDTQLTVATMKGLIAGHEKALASTNFSPYMDHIAEEHVKALQDTTAGWGKSTVESIRRLSNGVHWGLSGKCTEMGRGTGNGVPMKISPLAAWKVAREHFYIKHSRIPFDERRWVTDFSAMTHYSEISAHAAAIHFTIMEYCLTYSPKGDERNISFFRRLMEDVLNNPLVPSSSFTGNLTKSPDDYLARLKTINTEQVKKMTINEIREAYGNGDCYVYNSVPFAYAMFLRNTGIGAIFDTVNAGGDTDTNAKLVGEMVGALYGIEIFQHPDTLWMLEGLLDYQKLLDLANQFCDCFMID